MTDSRVPPPDPARVPMSASARLSPPDPARAPAPGPARVLTWQVTETGGFETAWVTPTGPRSFSARGRVFAALPHPYWLSYELETGPDWITRRLTVTAETTDATVHLDLRRDDGSGDWTANGVPLPWADPGTLDCDLGLSPLTNAMPVLRHDLHRAPGSQDCRMAWVSVPDLTVHASPQTYTHTGPGPAGTRVHFSSGDFASDVEFDEDGFVTSYVDLAHRLSTR
ncbi:putative glycolipid-binding domain-containing protein [Streptomyces sp. N35]|uniref:putative glycolipid-binding domain-containing protein n=1 Tax=Streptomyces sp. N35 TaxID=2795730 RepID=UPI001F48D4EB|nr:putative glycolipid-binding domain-containing protein [Streptomyces sp. N35]